VAAVAEIGSVVASSSRHEQQRTFRLESVLGDSLALLSVHAIHVRRLRRCRQRLAEQMDSSRFDRAVGVLSRLAGCRMRIRALASRSVELPAVSSLSFLRVTAFAVMSLSSRTEPAVVD